MTKKNIVCPLSTEEDAQSGDIVEDRALDHTRWIDEECGELVLDGVLKVLESCIVR